MQEAFRALDCMKYYWICQIHKVHHHSPPIVYQKVMKDNMWSSKININSKNNFLRFFLAHFEEIRRCEVIYFVYSPKFIHPCEPFYYIGLVMYWGTRKPETRGKTWHFWTPNPRTKTRVKPNNQNPKTRGVFRFQGFR